MYVDCSDTESDGAQKIVSEQANVFFKYLHKQMELKQSKNKRKPDPLPSHPEEIVSKMPKLSQWRTFRLLNRRKINDFPTIA